MADFGLQSLDEAGELLRHVLSASRDRISLLDERGACLVARQDAGGDDLTTGVGHDPCGAWLDGWAEASHAALLAGIEMARSGRVSNQRVERVDDDERQIWDVTISPVRNAGVARFIVVARDATAEVREKEAAAAVVAETRHRLKNGMTIAAGLVMLEARTKPDLKGFARSICGRFEQLAVVQDMVLDHGSRKDLPRILHLLAAVYGDGSLLRIGELPMVELNDFSTQALALTFGELATNSLKHGALKNALPVDLEGSIKDGQLTLCWKEPTRFAVSRADGQGLRLIDRLITAAGGHVERSVGADLLEVQITVLIS